MNSAVNQMIHGFLFNRAEQERTGKSRDSYRNLLREVIMEDGREDENGHRWLDFEEDLTVEGKTYKAICAQRRISSSIDLDATESLSKELNLYDEVFPVKEVRQFDEDRLYALNQQGKITDEQLDSLITEVETFAIVPVKS
jgi:hypothetical protein